MSVQREPIGSAHPTRPASITRRCQDSINPRTHPDIMLHSPEIDPSNREHPYWYARVIGIYHAWVSRTTTIGFGPSTPAQRAYFLWVRWFELDTSAPGGFLARRLHRLRFVNSEDPTTSAFSFINPNDVLRAAHIFGAYAHGRTDEYLPPSVARLSPECDEDWKYYYANM